MELTINGLEKIQVYRSDAMREFQRLFGKLRKKYKLGMHSHESIYENEDSLIEIWRNDENGKRIKTISRVKRKDAEECYRIAASDLMMYDKWQQEKENRDRN